jgi:hypothetical protein
LDNSIQGYAPKIDLVVDVRGKPFRVSGLAAEMLNRLVKAYPHKVLLNDLHRVVGEGSLHSVRKRLTITLEQQDLTLEYLPWDGVRLIEKSPVQLDSIGPILGEKAMLDRRPIFANPSTPGNKHGIAISIDGIILNSASELIYGSVDGSRVQNCRLLYRSSIEDLAFALVYGSKLSSKWRAREEVASDLGVNVSAIPREPAEILISQLGDKLYRSDIEDERFRYGRVLDDEQSRLQIGQYISSLGKAIHRPLVREICREWLVREADTYLGEHKSLFEPAKNGNRLHFQKKYYENAFLRDVPDLLGQDAVKTLVGFLPKTPHGKRKTNPYSRRALQHFAMCNVLTHLTTMYEYERIAETEIVHRLPFILRGLVKEEWHKDYETEGELRTLLVRSALYEGLREAEDSFGREQLVARLLWVRKKREFVEIRNFLGELSALVKEQRSREVEKLLAEIRGSRQQPGFDAVDRMGLSRNTVRPRMGVKEVDAGKYMERLEKFFPEISTRPLSHK